MPKNSLVALIPARSGSERVKNKNIKKIGDVHLIGYSIKAAIKSKIFDDIFVITDSEYYKKIAISYGVSVPFTRPKYISKSTSPDIEWVRWALKKLSKDKKTYNYFSILRPTSPFRSANTIRRAFKLFIKNVKKIDSLRAVEECSQHPGKMWRLKDKKIIPIFDKYYRSIPWHSCQKKVLPKIFVQNASLEISKTILPLSFNSISGKKILPFFTKGIEGFDINDKKDILIANMLIKNKKLI